MNNITRKLKSDEKKKETPNHLLIPALTHSAPDKNTTLSKSTQCFVHCLTYACSGGDNSLLLLLLSFSFSFVFFVSSSSFWGFRESERGGNICVGVVGTKENLFEFVAGVVVVDDVAVPVEVEVVWDEVVRVEVKDVGVVGNGECE